jgi:hypothetical protein
MPRYSGQQNYDNIAAATHNLTGGGFSLPHERIAIIVCLGTIPVGVVPTRKK